MSNPNGSQDQDIVCRLRESVADLFAVDDIENCETVSDAVIEIENLRMEIKQLLRGRK